MFRLLPLLIAAAAVVTLSPADAQRRQHDRYDGSRGYHQPPCEPGKQRVIINGNSQCRYPWEIRGRSQYRGYDDRYSGRRAYRQPPCEPGKQRVNINGNSQCRYPWEIRGRSRYRGYDDGYSGRRTYREPPCEPGKHRVIINGNSQCRYPWEIGGRARYRDHDDGYRRGRYRPGVIGEGPRVGCAPGEVRVVDGGNGSCRPARNYRY